MIPVVRIVVGAVACPTVLMAVAVVIGRCIAVGGASHPGVWQPDFGGDNTGDLPAGGELRNLDDIAAVIDRARAASGLPPDTGRAELSDDEVARRFQRIVEADAADQIQRRQREGQ